jgi:ribonuclease HI
MQINRKVTIYSDGGSRGNPGLAAIGAVIHIDDYKLEVSREIGEATNNVAEYRALIEALKETKQALGSLLSKKVIVDCYLDSELIVKQLNKEYKVKNPQMYELNLAVQREMLNFKSVNFYHIKRELNKEADKLVNQALDHVRIN